MLPVFGGTCHCEQLISSMKYVKSRTRKYLTEEHLKECIYIVKT
jgi:hypothetical protein